MKRLGWVAVVAGALILAGCGETTPVKKQQETTQPAADMATLQYKPHPRIDKITLWHKQGLTTGHLKAYDSFIMVPAVLATEDQLDKARIQVVNATIVQEQMPSMVADAMHPRYELAWEVGPNRMAVRIVLLAAASQPAPESEQNYLPVSMVLATPTEDSESPDMRRITVAASAIRIDLFDANSKERFLSLVDSLDEVKAAWQQEEQAALIDFEQLVRHWAVKVRFNLDSLQDVVDQPLEAS